MADDKIATRGVTTLATAEGAREGMIAAAQAEVEGRYLMARRFPRAFSLVREKILATCERLTFAEKARFSRPAGKKKNEETGAWEEVFAVGFSIRFAEEALRQFGNMDAFAMPVHDDDERVILRCGAIDYETNAAWRVDVEIPKIIERKFPKKGQTVLGTRENSYGDLVSLVRPTAAEMKTATAAEISKGTRTAILRLIPADLLEDAEVAVRATLAAEVKRDPAGAWKKIADAFRVDLQVSVEELALYLGHPVDDGVSAEEHVELRAVYMTVREGHARWRDLLAERIDGGDGDGGGTKENPALTAARQKLASAAAAKKAGTPPVTGAAPPATSPGGSPGAAASTPAPATPAPSTPAATPATEAPAQSATPAPTAPGPDRVAELAAPLIAAQARAEFSAALKAAQQAPDWPTLRAAVEAAAAPTVARLWPKKTEETPKCGDCGVVLTPANSNAGVHTDCPTRRRADKLAFWLREISTAAGDQTSGDEIWERMNEAFQGEIPVECNRAHEARWPTVAS